MVLWEVDMHDGSGEPVLGWHQGKVHSFCNRPPYNFILKYSKEVTGLRKLDGFINSTLLEAGVHGYGRRWVWLIPTSDRPKTRGSGEESLSPEEEAQLKALSDKDDAEENNNELFDDLECA